LNNVNQTTDRQIYQYSSSTTTITLVGWICGGTTFNNNILLTASDAGGQTIPDFLSRGNGSLKLPPTGVALPSPEFVIGWACENTGDLASQAAPNGYAASGHVFYFV
jgi:hypothetical protein